MSNQLIEAQRYEIYLGLKRKWSKTRIAKEIGVSKSTVSREIKRNFKDDAEYNPDLMRIVEFISKIADRGAFERYFRPEGRYNDSVCALPVIKSKLRLYCLRLSDKILILGNGGIKSTRTYNEDNTFKRICYHSSKI